MALVHRVNTKDIEASKKWLIDKLDDLDLSKQWTVIIEPYKKRRTPAQNRLYWVWMDAVAAMISEYTGYEKDEVHEYCKQRFIDGQSITLGGVTIPLKTTTKLDAEQMAEYMDRIYRWATVDLELALPLPPPKTEDRSGAGK